jgi:molybdenum cofactor cytidylyltransferase
MITLLSHESGGMKDVPDVARVIPAINKVETPEQLAAARQIARGLLQRSRSQQVLLSSSEAAGSVVEVQRRVTAVVLAAGESKRMGRSKQLLPWGETTLLGQTLRNLKEAAVHDILVVTGAEAARVAAIAQMENVATVHNEQWAAREMLSSLQAAVRELPENRSGVLVMLADQPMVKAPVINLLQQAYARGEGLLIAPEYGGRRGNPVLIDRAYFAELLGLSSGAPRDLLRRHLVTLVPVSTAAVLQDIDDLEAYHRYRPN